MAGSCPLLRAGQTPNPRFLHDPYACIQDDCAWWVHDAEHPDCAIVVRASQPVNVEGNTLLLAWIDRHYQRRQSPPPPQRR